jgi:hypothetical protein
MKQHLVPILITVVIVAILGNSATLSNIVFPATKPLP